jgi:tetratricopeptide (TPR) repeat protein
MRPRALSTIVAAALALASAGCGKGSPETPVFANQAPGVRYVGAEACTPCHREIAETYAHTGMGRSFYPMSAAVAAALDFSRDNEIEIHGSGLRYRMSERGGRWFMRQFVLGGGGREIAVDEREMLYVVGSGNHSRAFLTKVDDKLYQMPVCWYPQGTLWDLCPGYEHENDRFTREIGNTCVFCHNARMERVQGSRNRYEAPYPAGIDCERCHGPGQLHVARWTAGKETPSGGADATIVNPRRLALETRIHVCFQCHLGDAKAGERVPRHDRALEDFRPGQLITEVSVPMQYAQSFEGAFGLSAQADRLLLSRCYKESGGKIECLTCHNPHVTTYDPTRSQGFYRDRCLECHRVSSCPAPAQARQATTPPDDCIDCHMRKAEPDDQRHTEFTDHWIRKRIQPPAHEARASIDFAPVFQAAFDALPQADRDFYRGRINLLKSLETPPGVRNAMWAEADPAFRSAVDHGFRAADVWFFLGKTLSYQKRWDAAESALKRAREVRPGYPEASFQLGRALLAQKKLQEAAGVYEEMLRADPRDPAALAELASCRLAENRKDEALALNDRALREDPGSARLHANRCLILMSMGRTDEAARSALEAARLDPADAAVWGLAAEVLTRAGRSADAADAGSRAKLLAARPRREGSRPGSM